MLKKPSVFEVLPYEMQVRSGLEGILVGKMVGEGLILTRQKIAAGLPVSEIFELEAFQQFFSAATPIESLEAYALKAGHNAALGWALNEIAQQNAAQDVPGSTGLIAKARRGLGFKKSTV